MRTKTCEKSRIEKKKGVVVVQQRGQKNKKGKLEGVDGGVRMLINVLLERGRYNHLAFGPVFFVGGREPNLLGIHCNQSMQIAGQQVFMDI